MINYFSWLSAALFSSTRKKTTVSLNTLCIILEHFKLTNDDEEIKEIDDAEHVTNNQDVGPNYLVILYNLRRSLCIFDLDKLNSKFKSITLT